VARDLGYRRNQWPAGITMVQIERRFCALRVRDGRPVELRRQKDGDWEALALSAVGRAWRPWVLRLTLADGSLMKVRPFRPGEAGLPDCGDRVGGIGDSEQLGNDPVSAVVAVVAIVFYVLVAPFFIAANVKRAKAARELRAHVARSAAILPGTGVGRLGQSAHRRPCGSGARGAPGTGPARRRDTHPLHSLTDPGRPSPHPADELVE
jgi:hypothetical protein